MDATETVRAYYNALRAGEPLPPFFAEHEDLVKVGITERLVGYEAVADGLREQTEETDDWTVESRDLRVAADGDTAWFSDEVRMAWTEAAERREYDSRWSGTLVRSPGPADDGTTPARRSERDGGDERAEGVGSDEGVRSDERGESDERDENDEGDERDENDEGDERDERGEWRFVGMHVSAPD